MRFVQVLALSLTLGAAVAAAGMEKTRVHHRFPQLNQNSPNQYSVLRSSAGTYNVTQGYDSTNEFLQNGFTLAATAIFNTTMNEYGWDYLYVAPNGNWMKDSKMLSTGYHAAGFAEGYITWSRLVSAGAPGAFQIMINNTNATSGADVASVTAWVDEHITHMQNAAASNGDNTYYVQLGLLLQQLQGLSDGFNAASENQGSPLRASFKDIFALNFAADELGDVVGYVQLTKKKMTYFKDLTPPRHCSALIKITDDDLFVSHDTWSSFQSMRRVYKTYAFQTTVSMSSYPGTIASGDDWYMTSNKLAIQETTNEFYNTSLYAGVVPDTVSEFLRVMIATYLADSGSQWTTLFANENSGTYNNQYMVVDMKKWQPGQKGEALQDDLLWVAEQIPGFVQSQDVTSVLRSQGYWPSFNTPYFKYIYDISGFRYMEEMYGDFYSYTKYARPRIFKRNHTDVTDLTTMQLMMRYNHFETDPLSAITNCSGCPSDTCNPRNSAMLSIASRGDLNPVMTATNGICYGPNKGYVRHRDHCATDSKIASWSNFQGDKQTGIVISGPTAVQQPVFRFSASGIDRPDLLPDSWNFPWMQFKLPAPKYVPPHLEIEGSNKTVVGVVVAAAIVGFVLGVLGAFHARRIRQRGHESYTNLDAAQSTNRDAAEV